MFMSTYPTPRGQYYHPHSVDREAEALEDAELAYMVTAQWHGPSELELVASSSFTA